MAAVKETYLICDVCSTNFGVDNRSYNAAQQRKDAARNGWIYSGNKDYCPSCRATTKAGTIHKSKALTTSHPK